MKKSTYCIIHAAESNCQMANDYKSIADEIIKRLKAEGFTIQRYDAYSTKSIYLKLDYGLAYSIRISDHAGKKHLKYTYNLIKNYSGRGLIKEDGVWRQYYNFAHVDTMIANVIKGREWVMKNYHPDYAASMEARRIENQGKRGFWESAVLV